MGGVVEAVVDAAIGWLVQSILGSLFTEQIQAWARDVGLAEDVENLKSEMRDVEMVLAAAEGRRIENKPLVRSLHDLKELLYDAEDVMDELDYYRLQQQIEQGEGCTDSEESSVASSTPSLQLACTSTASRIVGLCRGDRKRKREEEPTYSTISERIRGIVDHLGKLRSSVREVLQLEISQPITMANQSQSAVKNKRMTTSIPIEDKVYGRDAERDKIVELLINGKSSDLQVLPIVGIGGIGKTTLARFVYSHQRIKEHFDLQMWVCVSTNFDTMRLTREILEHVCTDRQQFEKITNFNVLQDILLKNLENKRFLLVFDDMWEEKDRRGWFSLLDPLKHNHVPGCMILATTRSPSVAKMIETMDSVSVKGLDEKEFWLFFKACAFGNESHQGHPSLQSIGQHIVKALKGCPLAARSVGALLNKDITYEHWRTVQNKWKSLQEDTDDILPILKLSYDFLPVRLQHCFSYCSLFPEDYRFNWENLVHAWISQNFVQCEDPSKRLEETGKEYLDNLVDFGFFQKVDSDYVMHDLMHELAQMVSLNECAIINGYNSRAIQPSVRHLSIITTAYEKDGHCSIPCEKFENILENIGSSEKLRTLMVFGTSSIHLLRFLHNLCMKSKCLRVVRIYVTHKDVSTTSELLNPYHLRYLEFICVFSNIDLKKNIVLPQALTKFYHLLFFDANIGSNISVPTNMNNLLNLRNIVAHEKVHSEITGVGKLTSCAEQIGPEVQIFSSSLGAMVSLLAKLRSLLVCPENQVPEPLKSQKDKLELLKQDLEAINASFVNLSWVEAPNMMVKHWMNEVRDLSYDIEDYIDKMMHPGHISREEPRSDSEVEELSTLVKQAKDAHERQNRYDLGRWASNPRFVVDVGGQGWVPRLNRDTTDLVGMDDSKAELTKRLNIDAEQRLVMSIQGPPGVGKTTIVKQVYCEIEGHFEYRAFVRASKMPDTRRLLSNIISQILPRHQGPPHGLPVQELIDNLRKRLQQKRYLIVIDGLWETTSWDIVSSAFPDDAHCSRILITTDIEEVALECSDYESDAIFKMEPLGGNHSTELFFNRVFGFKHKCSKQLKESSEEIIRACGGLPLAIISIASILAIQPDNLELWRHVKEALFSRSRYNLTSEVKLREIVGLSYNILPRHLKTCLLYLSMYPEGYTFLKADLVKQWSAEGFIIPVEEKVYDEVAECYFDELTCRGLIQPNHTNISDEVTLYTLHSTVFEVIRSMSIEENFSTVIDYSNTISEVYVKVRRLSLRFSSAKYATKPESIALSPVRSLIFYGLLECLPSIMKFEVLRVLILDVWGDHDQEELDLSGIDRLFQLRYMRITSNIIVKLPAQMIGLPYLQTMEIYARVSSVPSDIVRLPRLLHLCVHGKINLPNGIGHMRSLRTLQSFDLSSNCEENVQQLGEMTDLHDLHVTSPTEMSDPLKRKLTALVISLEKLVNLKSIIIAPASSCTSIFLDCSWSISSLSIFLQRLELLPPICIFSRLPVWIGQLQKLSILKIVLRELTTGDVYSITKLQELSILSLYVRQPTAEQIVFHRTAFPALKVFKFRCGIMRIAFQPEAMPRLRSLNLEFNAHTGEQNGNMLAGIEHLLNLQEITGRVGAAPGAEESDRIAVESVFKDAISKHSRLTNFNLQIVGLFDEEWQKKSEIDQVPQLLQSCDASEYSLGGMSGPGTPDETAEGTLASIADDDVGVGLLPAGNAGSDEFDKDQPDFKRRKDSDGEGISMRLITHKVDTGNYNGFIRDLRDILAKVDHSNIPKEYVVDSRYNPPINHYVLPKQRHPREPERWIYIKLELWGGAETTLAVRDDNVDLMGFKNKRGEWFEFGFSGTSRPMLRGSRFLECDVNYGSLVHGGARNLVGMRLSRRSACSAVTQLSGYTHGQRGIMDDRNTKHALAGLMVMVCEATRMSPFLVGETGWHAEGCCIDSRHVDYIWGWGDMSEALLRWKRDPDTFKFPKCLRDIGVGSASQAFDIVELLLNTPIHRPPRWRLDQWRPAAGDDDARRSEHQRRAADDRGHRSEKQQPAAW